MDSIITVWLNKLYDAEIEQVKGTISNERLWEHGYSGEEPNPHTENIARLVQYLKVLEELKKKIITSE